MPPRITLEVAVTTPEEAVAAVSAGADRLELCSALEVGGVTPSQATFLLTRLSVAVPLFVLVRPRTGGFVTDQIDVGTIAADIGSFLAVPQTGDRKPADGVVFGAIESPDRIDPWCRRWAGQAAGRITFHRAFDFLSHLPAALEQLIDIGFKRVLTSGGAPTALEGADVIAGLVRQAAGRIEILPGGGVTPENVVELVRRTGCTQVHGSFRSPVHDPTLAGNPALAVGMGGGMALDPAKVAAARAALDRYSAGG